MMHNLRKRQKQKSVTTTKLPFTGKLTAPVLMVVDPVVGNLDAKSPLSTRQLQWFVDHLRDNGGFKKEDVCIISASTPVTHDTWGQNKLTSDHLKEWKDELHKIIDRNKPKMIMPFGAKACQQVFGKSVQITKVRGQPVQELGICHNTPILPMLSPFYAQRQPENEASFVADMQTAGRIYKAGYDLDHSAIDYKHDYQWCWDPRKLWKLLRNKKLLSVDVETVGLKGFDPDTKLLTIQFCYEKGKAIIVPIDYDKGPLRYHNFVPWKRGMREKLIAVCKRVLENPRTKVFGQNFKFDWLMLWYMLGIEVTNYADDIQLLAHLLDENSRSLNIDDLVRRYAPEMAGFNDCVAPHTRILKADHTWVLADQLKPGDELIGFDEHLDTSGESNRKKLRRSVVKSVKRRIKPGYRITYGSGRALEVSDNHELLFKRGSAGGGNYWRMVRDLKGHEIPVIFPFKPDAPSPDQSWLGGFLDGEGYCVNHGSKGMRIGFSQNDNPALHKAVEVSNNICNKSMYVGLPAGKSCYNAVVAGWSALEVLQQCPTYRLREKTTWEGMSMPQPDENDYMRCIEPIGNIETVSIETTTHTFIAEGVASHNCHNNDPDHHGKTRMDLLPPDKMLPYGCGDTDAAWRLLPVLKEQVWADQGKNASLRDTYIRVTMPAQRAFCYIELNGFPVSHKELNEFQRKLKRIQKRERIYLLKQIPKSIKDKHKDTGVGLKVNRGVILRDWLYNHPDGLQLKPVLYTKTKQPSVSSKEALPYYVADHPVVARLIDYIKNDKLLNTYAKGFHKYIYDGLIRPSYGLTGTVTGRSMSRDPNGQNFPKRGKLAKEYRKVFKAPPGWVFVSCDLSQAELRIAAMMSGDPNMLAVYKSGGDIHRTTAAGTMGISLEKFLKLDKDVQGLKRFQAKAINFGFLYGMWWVKFRSYAKTEYGIDFTEKEAEEIRTKFFKTYPMLEDWHRDVQDYVAVKGKIRAYSGRLRHLPNVFSEDQGIAKQAMRQAINSPVQSIASDLGLMTLGRLVPHIRKKGYDWIKPCGFIHDAIVCLVREDMVARGCSLVKWFMESNPLEEWFNWSPEVPIIADAEIGRTLAETVELKPIMFEGKHNAHKTFDDLVKEATEKDDDKASTIKTKHRKIKLKRSKHHAEIKTAERTGGSRKRIRKNSQKSQRRIKRGKSSKDRAA